MAAMLSGSLQRATGLGPEEAAGGVRVGDASALGGKVAASCSWADSLQQPLLT